VELDEMPSSSRRIAVHAFLTATSLALALLFLVPANGRAQAPVDSALAAYIAGIRAIDTHAHPMRPVPAGAPADTEYDALPLDGIPPFGFQQRLSLSDPIWRRAQDALYHVPAAPSDSAYLAALRRSALRERSERGARFPE
jgi:hypothetical protein